MRYILYCIILILMTGCAIPEPQSVTGWECYSCEDMRVLRGIVAMPLYTNDMSQELTTRLEYELEQLQTEYDRKGCDK